MKRTITSTNRRVLLSVLPRYRSGNYRYRFERMHVWDTCSEAMRVDTIIIEQIDTGSVCRKVRSAAVESAPWKCLIISYFEILRQALRLVSLSLQASIKCVYTRAT